MTTQSDLEIIIGEESNTSVKIEFAADTVISGDAFTGTIDLPDGQNDSGCPVNFEKEDETVESCVEIGKKGETISVSKPVRIILSGQGNNTPYTATHDGEERIVIETQCSADLVDPVASQIGGEGQPDMCYIKVGNDMVIWTSHFTAFGTISTPITTTTESVSSSSSSGDRPPPKIDGIGLFKILDSDTSSLETPKFEEHFPYSMHSYITDSLNYGSHEEFVKVGQFFELDGYSTEILPVIAKEGENIQFQVRLYDKYKGVYIEHVSLYFTDKDSDKIGELDTFISYEQGDALRVGDPDGIFGDVQVSISPEFDAYWVIFDVQFSDHLDTKNILIEAWHESQQPSYAKVVNAVELLNPLTAESVDDTLKIARVNIPSIHTSPECADTNSCFDPFETTILKDGIVTWVNEDASFIHAITSGTIESGPNNKFNGFLRPGTSFEFQFGQTGIYPYYCSIHPWTSGVVNVIDKDGSTTIDLNLRDSTPGVNISGTLNMPDEVMSPLELQIIDGGNYILVEAGSTHTLETRNLSAEVSGNVGDAIRGQQVTLTIIRPDTTQESVSTLVNSDGEYFFPTRLADDWQRGDYNLIAEYNGVQIGNLPFKLKSSTEYEFGGMLVSPSVHTMISLENYVDLKIPESQLDENLSNYGWSDSSIEDIKDRLRAIFYVDSPREQLHSGITSDEVICNVGLQITQFSDGDPKCVKIDSIEKLIQRGLISP